MSIQKIKTGVNKIITTARFRDDIIKYSRTRNLDGVCSKEVAPAILKSIPKRFEDSFIKLSENPECVKTFKARFLADTTDFFKEVYNYYIDKPIAMIKSAVYFTKEKIKCIGKEKQPTFYRFIGEAELRRLKKGELIQSSAWYNQKENLTDITSKRHLNWNKYRVTFKKNPEWNPIHPNSKVKEHDADWGYWWLVGPYSKKDIVCTERIFH